MCGEATYTDDMKLTADALVGVAVTSTKPHARLLRVDASKALTLNLELANATLAKSVTVKWSIAAGTFTGVTSPVSSLCHRTQCSSASFACLSLYL